MGKQILIEGEELDREDMVQFVAHSIATFEDVENTKTLQAEVRKLSDKELEKKVLFADYLWDK